MIHIILFSLLVSVTSYASSDLAKMMVPRGKLIESIGRDHVVKTAAGTKIYVEFKRDGKFEEAKGQNLNHGDELEPGEGLLSLGSAAQALKSRGEKPEGPWFLEQDPELGWVYEFGESLVNAKTGQVIKFIPKIISTAENI